ncbi:DNA-binding response OmpR family regulator [Friedmanniella endophytica]|uniref:DNA-binding response OmpR family regulator n=1 Tax=Microlunatus kandeliicorticis TaxID=1759536 RepID=A0A7W3P5I1_9ACTN|nr:response regulator [Microlunatus kandeliicorticis]MBA8793887.1 DNA-binding response OmpR family regulator [Microlunatus kandeliicorticis]
MSENGASNAARILVADDEEDIRDFVEIKLRSAGMDVVTADNGDDALKILSTDTGLDLAVLDVMMPGMTGIEVLREVRAHGASKDVPVILLTAKARESDVELGYAVGTTDYLTKPFSPMELLLRIKATLGYVE